MNARQVRRPGQRPFHRVLRGTLLAGQWLLRQALGLAELLQQVFRQRAGVEPFVLLAGGLVLEAHPQARAQHGLGLQRVAQLGDAKRSVSKNFGSGQNRTVVPVFFCPTVPISSSFEVHLAAAEADVVFLAAAPHPALQLLRQRIDHRHTDAMQAAGELVVGVRELAAGMQPREDQLHAADLLLRMDVHRHAAAVVGDLQRAILEQRHLDQVAVARQRLVDAVVDDFMREMVGPRGVGVHARAATHGVEAGEHLDIRRTVGRGHSISAGRKITGAR